MQDAGAIVLQRPKIKNKSYSLIEGVKRTLSLNRTLNRSETRVYPVAPDDVNRVFGGPVNILNLAYNAQSA